MLLARGVRRFPPPYRRQTALIIAGAIVPWIGNFLYLTRVTPVTAVDITPLAFAVSGLCFTWGLYRYRLFGLVPVARDMVVDSMEDGVMVLDARPPHRRPERRGGALHRLHDQLRRPARSDEVVPWWNDAAAEARASSRQPRRRQDRAGAAVSSRCRSRAGARSHPPLHRLAGDRSATSPPAAAPKPSATRSSDACRSSRSPRA